MYAGEFALCLCRASAEAVEQQETASLIWPHAGSTTELACQAPTGEKRGGKNGGKKEKDDGEKEKDSEREREEREEKKTLFACGGIKR